MTNLPVVTHETALVAICDIFRSEMEGGEDSNTLMDAVAVVANENPEVLKSVNSWITSDYTEDEKKSALLGMAITYRVLKAQLETEALERLAGL